MNRLAVCLSALLIAPASFAQPIGPNATLPGFTLPESQDLHQKATAAMERYERLRGGPPLTPGTKSFLCALAGFTAAIIVGEVHHAGADIHPAARAAARKSLVFLNDLMNRHCERPRGGDIGTGNDGDKLLGFAANKGPVAKVPDWVEAMRGLLGAGVGLGAGEGALAPAGALVPVVPPAVLPNPVKRTDPRDVL